MAASLLLFALAPIFRRADVVSRAPPEPRGAVQWRSMATLAAAFCATPAIAATLTPKPVREALAARFSRAFRRLRHGQTIAAYPAAFASILDEEAKAERADAKAERTERAAERQRAYDRRMEEQWRPREKASMKDVEVEEVDWDDEGHNASWPKWTTCGLCKQDYHGVVCAALGWACWKAYVGLPEGDDMRCAALSTLSRSIHHIPGMSVICIHQANLDSVRRFMSDDDEDDLLRAQTHLAQAYENVGRTSEALALHREIYAKTKELVDEGEDLVDDLINTVSGLSSTLMEAGRFREARTLLHEHLTVASDSLGVDHVETLYIHLYYADSLIYEDDDHGEETDDEQDRKDFLEAERIAADVLCRAERIYGSHHPGTIYARDILKDAREELAAQERRRTLRPRPKRARTS